MDRLQAVTENVGKTEIQPAQFLTGCAVFIIAAGKMAGMCDIGADYALSLMF